MAYIPPEVAEDAVSRELRDKGMVRLHQGKVRDTYALAQPGPNGERTRLVVATDRISAFDFVLSARILGKGVNLTVLTVFWLRSLLGDFKHHLLAAGEEIDQYLLGSLRSLRGKRWLQERALVVRELEMLPIECIARGYLTGSGLIAYQETGKVCGIELPPGLHDGSWLGSPIFTPTDKAQVGHDEHLIASDVMAEYGEQPKDLTLMAYARVHSYLFDRGILLADTKLEFGRDPKQPEQLVLADEVFTPDSSRFWPKAAYEMAQAADPPQAPVGYDKQYVREACKKLGINKRDPKVAGDPEFVGGIHFPEHILARTSELYDLCTEACIGMSLWRFQKVEMGI